MIDPEYIPNWTAIEQDDVRKEYELPWLQRELDRATESGLHNMAPGREYWLGVRDALKDVIERPKREVEEAAAAHAERVAMEREKENGRQHWGPARLRRLVDPAEWGRVRSEPGTTVR